MPPLFPVLGERIQVLAQVPLEASEEDSPFYLQLASFTAELYAELVGTMIEQESGAGPELGSGGGGEKFVEFFGRLSLEKFGSNIRG